MPGRVPSPSSEGIRVFMSKPWTRHYPVDQGSTADGETLIEMPGVLDLVDEGDGVVLVGDAGLAVISRNRSVEGSAVMTGALAGCEVDRRRGDVSPGHVVAEAQIGVECLDLADRVRLELLGEFGGVEKAHAVVVQQ